MKTISHKIEITQALAHASTCCLSPRNKRQRSTNNQTYDTTQPERLFQPFSCSLRQVNEEISSESFSALCNEVGGVRWNEKFVSVHVGSQL